MTTAGREPHVELLNISKRFGGVQALDDVTVRIAAGSVHALVGENGAGKSTLSKICAGVMPPDAGSIVIAGVPVTLRSPRDALLHGIASIAQELALVPHLSVEQNVFLGSEPAAGAFLRPRALRKAFNALAAEAGFDLDPAALVGGLRTADQQKVEILRALSRGASMIIMDEPSAALSGPDTARLHAVIKHLAGTGHTVVLISHFLSEVLQLADTVTILRDGRHVRTAPARDENNASLIEGMLGRTLESVFPDKPPRPSSDAPVVFAASDVTAPGVNNVSIEVRAGEIVGLAGLVGAGRTELARALTGAAPAVSADVRLHGKQVALRSPRHALRRGVVMIPESRKEQGLVLQRAIDENVTLANLSDYSRGGMIGRRREQKAVRGVLEQVRVKAPSLSSPIAGLSGGNQQKTLFARALLCKPSVLVADEPTRGVDVGSRRAIYDLIVEQAQAGVGVVVISSDVEEVLGLAHRVLVMRGGRVVAELTDDQMTEANVLHAAFAEVRPDQTQEPGDATDD